MSILPDPTDWMVGMSRPVQSKANRRKAHRLGRVDDRDLRRMTIEARTLADEAAAIEAITEAIVEDDPEAATVAQWERLVGHRGEDCGTFSTWGTEDDDPVDEAALHAEGKALLALIEAAEHEALIDDHLDEVKALMGSDSVFDPDDIQWGFTVSTRPVGSHGGCTQPRDEAGRFC